MRCDEVIRELAVPSDHRDGTALAEHLTGCPSCAAWNRRAGLLDRLWDATRPPEPSPQAWDSVWANINHALQSAPDSRELAATSPTVSRPGTSPKVFVHPGPDRMQPADRPRTGRVMAIAMLVGLAQAAAILIAVGLAWRIQPVVPAGQGPPVAQNDTPAPAHLPSMIRVSQPVVFEMDIEEGHLMKFCVDGASPRVEDLTPQELFGVRDGFPGDMMMFNAAESFARTVVASQ
jgi:hypothetical protein